QADIPQKLFFILSFLITYVIYFTWRWNYYGYIFPNTYYVRMGMTISTLLPQFKRGFFYFMDFLVKYGGWSMIFSLFLIRRKSKKIINLLVFLSIASVIYIIYVGGDSKQFFRLLVPFMSFYYILVQEGLVEFKNLLSEKYIPAKKLLKSTIILFFLVLMILSNYFPTLWFLGLSQLKEYSIAEIILGKTANFQQILWFRENQRLIGLYMKDHLPPNTSIAVIVAGSIPYFSELMTIDMLGLNEPFIAHQEVLSNIELNKQIGTVFPKSSLNDIKIKKALLTAAHQKVDLEYVLSKNPTILFVGDPIVLEKNGYKKFEKVTEDFTFSYWAKEDPFF
ncbi:hypothetical protein KKB18_08795, partial [bacterium]|nr:hypothetical protein [bacterium]